MREPDIVAGCPENSKRQYSICLASLLGRDRIHVANIGGFKLREYGFDSLDEGTPCVGHAAYVSMSLRIVQDLTVVIRVGLRGDGNPKLEVESGPRRRLRHQPAE